MPKFIIERNIPNAGKMSIEDLKHVAEKSCGVLRDMNHNGIDVQWVHSYVTGDKIYCIYNAQNADAVKEHARRGGFPADRIEPVMEIIDPTTAE